MIHCQLSVRRHYCDAQYARDQAVASARDQALASVSPAVWITENTLFVWSLRMTASSCRITILRLADKYNRRKGLQTSAGGARMHCHDACMRRQADMYTITITS